MHFYLMMAAMTYGYVLAVAPKSVPLTLSLILMLGCAALWPLFWVWMTVCWVKDAARTTKGEQP